VEQNIPTRARPPHFWNG